MKPVSAAFSRVFRASPSEWQPEDFDALTSAELSLLARLMAVPHTGTKDQITARLLDAAALRSVLSAYAPDYGGAVHLAENFKRQELVEMARRAKVFYSLPKVGIAVSLINWRESCRRHGQSFLKEWQSQSKTMPRQLRLHFD